MRLRRLRISAFGPFADRVDLDFAALNDAGLFLLTGGNGAGKSSILDAVCFALYGAVPGDRNTARRYRSDHAGPEQSPTVELEAVFASGTYRIVRTAAWERPKRRGTGTTPQQASVSVSRRTDDHWEPVTSRLDEAGQLVTRLVGMNLTQFCQVVILPQGRFQAFLQSSANERQALLQQLFHTGRFQRVEAWLRDRRLTLRHRSADHEAALREVVNRISEASGTPVPDDEGDDLRAWATRLTDDSARALAEAEAQAELACADETQARAALEAGRDLRARLARLRSATAERADLEQLAPSIDELRSRVDAARRAAPVAVLGPLVQARMSALESVTAGHALAVGRVATLTGDLPRDLVVERDALRASVARFASLVPRADEAESLRAEHALVAAELEQAEARRVQLDGSDIAVRLDDLAAAQAALDAAELALPGKREAIDETRARLAAHEQAGALDLAQSAAVAELALATTRALDAKDAWLTVREARIEGMAAELAGALAVGADCPVCGSLDHPHPAEPHSDAPDAAAEKAAHREVDTANAVQHAHEGQVRELTDRLEQARAAAGDTTVDELRAELREQRAGVRRLLQIVETRATVEADLAAATARRRAETVEAHTLAERRAVLHERRDRTSVRLDVLDRELAAALADTPYPDARQAHDDLTDRLDAVEAAIAAAHAVDEARDAAAEASGARTTAALEAGFDSAAAAERSLLPPAELAALAGDISRHEARLSAVAAVLAEPELLGLEGRGTPDVTALTTVHRAADEARARAESAVAALRRRTQRLGTLLTELSARHDAWAPVRAELDLATRLSAFCEGKSADNRWQIQLSAYVVAWRLSQVAEAANVRLTVMTHGRYSLEHTDLRGAGERRGGMTLLVRDDWTGLTRDPVTLSGGETFVVALALALGLADVITAEAGGAALQTLFVDEGFGMLDATSLDLVMDTLDSLRESGRTVGVVSHVAEMRSRIPVQVQVHKPHDHGPSTVRLRA